METFVKLKTNNDKIIRIGGDDSGVSVQIHNKDGICPNEQRSTADDSQQDNRLLSNFNDGMRALHPDLRLHDTVRVTARTDTGKLIILEVFPTVRAQNELTEQEGVSCTGGHCDGEMLSDDQVRESLGLVSRYRDNLKILVKISADKNITLDVPPFQTVKYVKRMIQEKEGIPMDIQRLIFAGNVLYDQFSLNEFNIGNGSQLVLYRITRDAMEIFVWTMAGKVFKVRAKPCDTIDTLKCIIHRVSGFPPHQQRLLYAGRKLKGPRLLSDYHIEPESTVQLFLHPQDEIQVFAKDLSGKTWTLKLHPVDTVADLKVEIMKQTGIPTDQFRLVFTGRHLVGQHILHDVGIGNNSLVHFVYIFGGRYRETFGYLADEKTLGDYNILKEHTLNLIIGFTGNNVQIVTTANDMMMSRCDGYTDENIGTLKSRILDSEDTILPDERHVNIFHDTGHKCCCYFDPEKESSIHLILRLIEGMQIRVTTNIDGPIKLEHSNWWAELISHWFIGLI